MMSPLDGLSSDQQEQFMAKVLETMRRTEPDHIHSLAEYVSERFSSEDLVRLQETDLYQDLAAIAVVAMNSAARELSDGSSLVAALTVIVLAPHVRNVALAGFILGYEQHRLDVQKETLGLHLG